MRITSSPPKDMSPNKNVSSFQLIVPESGIGMRLDRFLLDSQRFVSRHQIQKLILGGRVQVDELRVKPSYRLKPFQVIRITIPPPEPDSSLPEPIPLQIVYEDEDLLVVNKPAGMVVHPAAGHRRNTLVNALLHHCKDLSGIGGTLRPGIVHRLDKGTSGLLVVAKHDGVHLALSKQFQVHTTVREYVGLVHGGPNKAEGLFDAPIGRHPKDRKRMSTLAHRGRHAVTYWKVESHFHGFTLMRFTLKTGRTHQIRVHLASQGYPIVGDPVYGGRKWTKSSPRSGMAQTENWTGLNRLFLHAEKLGFVHPRTKRFLLFSVPLPEELTERLRRLRPRDSTCTE